MSHVCRVLPAIALRVWLVAAYWVSPAFAQVGAPDTVAREQAYQAVIEQALTECELQHWEEARTLFAKAHALVPSARTWRGMGMVEFELRNYLASVEDLERALSARVKPLEGELRAETQALLARAREFVARVVLQLRPALREVSVLVDGAQVELRADGLSLPIGEHVIEVRADGYVPAKRIVQLLGSSVEEVRFELTPHDAVLRPETAPRADARPALYKNVWLWTGVAVVLVGAAATVTGLMLSREPKPHTVSGDPEVAGGLIQTLRWGR